MLALRDLVKKKRMEMKDSICLMVDVETIGNESTPALVQLSAVAYNEDTGETFEEFDELISPKSSIEHGLHCDGSTMSFWLKQDPEAINKVLVRAINEGKALPEVLTAFSAFVEKLKKTHNVKIVKFVCNGCDWSWVSASYFALKQQPPIPFYHARDIRMIVDWGISLCGVNPKKDMPFDGIKHDGLSDCRHQIKYVTAVRNAMKGNK